MFFGKVFRTNCWRSERVFLQVKSVGVIVGVDCGVECGVSGVELAIDKRFL